MDLKAELINLVGEGRLRSALDLALEKLSSGHDRHPEFILLSARMASVEREQMLGLLDTEDARRENNRITYAFLELLNDLEI